MTGRFTPRHGSVLPITDAEYQALKAHSIAGDEKNGRNRERFADF